MGYVLEGEGEYVREFDFTSVICFKKELKPEDIQKILDVPEHPLKTSIKAVK